jgi:hypothetical protein
MLNEKTQNKLSSIVDLWSAGQRMDASKKIKNLRKLEVCQLLTRRNEAQPNCITWTVGRKIEFEDFVERSLEGWFDDGMFPS